MVFFSCSGSDIFLQGKEDLKAFFYYPEVAEGIPHPHPVFRGAGSFPGTHIRMPVLSN